MTEEKIIMKAIVVTDQAAGTAGMKLVERPGTLSTLDNAVAAFNRTERRKGKMVIRVRP
jgi:hypothetical protein